MRGRGVMVLAMLCAAGVLVPAGAAEPADGRGNATVIAVLDNGFSPYHWDFLAAHMPQALNEDPSDDLPLDQPPHTWLPGFPSPATFGGYQPLNLTLEAENASRLIHELDAEDTAEWNKVRSSTRATQNYYWIPGTKVIGALTFGGGTIHSTSSAHGVGTSSVSAGNLYGGCPECLLVLIQFGTDTEGEAAIEWAQSQPWIDAITNSYGFGIAGRDRIYAGSDTHGQLAAIRRGQTVFFSAGNGVDGGYAVTNPTYFSSQEGPDWIVTVGAAQPSSGATQVGSGKPADITGVGANYESSYTAVAVGFPGNSGFGGTSNATPTIAGTYARALHLARRDLGPASTTQQGGVIARGTPFACGEERLDCELADGELTAEELRTRLFHGAVHTSAGLTYTGRVTLPAVGEEEFWAEGHGTYFVRARGLQAWEEEFDRIMAPLEGRAPTLVRPAGEREWMTVDSFCRQHLWGSWEQGYYQQGVRPLPPIDVAGAPFRSAVQTACPHLRHT